MTTQHDERAELIRQLVQAAHRKGELFERCQGKGWPDKESAEFHKLRDVTIPEIRAALLAADAQAGGENEADDLLRRLGLDPDQYRTDGGYINHLKVKAAIKNPNDYPRLNQCQHQFVHSADLGGRVCKLCGHPERSASPAAPAHSAEWPETPITQEAFNAWFDALPWYVRAMWPSAQAAAQVAQPLTQDEVFADDGIMEANSDAGLDMARIMQFVRAVEAAHGIGKDQG